MHYYGFEYQYGAHVCDSEGGDFGECYVFSTKSSRDQWVGERKTEYSTEPGYRAAYPAKLAKPWVKAGMIYTPSSID